MKTVESRIAFSRFIFEDAEQCALQGASVRKSYLSFQGIFLVWFESASLSDKLLGRIGFTERRAEDLDRAVNSRWGFASASIYIYLRACDTQRHVH